MAAPLRPKKAVFEHPKVSPRSNCNDCGGQPDLAEISNTTGVKCKLDYDMSQGESYTMRIYQISDSGSMEIEGQVYTGGVWRVTARCPSVARHGARPSFSARV